MAQKKEDIYGFQTYFREVGYYIVRREQYERGLKFFDQAIQKTPDDTRALLGRSWARAKATQYQGALDDINKALKIDPKDFLYVYLAHKALNTYLSCEFEDALVQNLRSLPKRKKPDNFAMGVMHCYEAIENCIGVRAGRPLRDYFKIIRKLAWKKAIEAQKPYGPKSTNAAKKKKKKKKKDEAKDKRRTQEPVVPKLKLKKKCTSPSATSLTQDPQQQQDVKQKDGEDASVSTNPTAHHEDIRSSLYTHDTVEDFIPPGRPFPYKPLQRYTTNIKNYMAEKYLDSLYLDKIFLENLKNAPGVGSPNVQGTKKIIQMCKNGYKALSYKQELLRTRRPFYFIKYQEATSSGALKARQEAETERLRNIAKKEAEGLLAKIKHSIEHKQTRVALELSEKLKTYCDSKPRRILPKRGRYLRSMYDLVCEAHFIMKRLNYKQFEWDQEKRIFTYFGVPLSRDPSTDSVLSQFKDVFYDYKKQISIYEDRLRKADSTHELAWLYHELSRFHCELKQFELARVYARKCIQMADEISNNKWVINARMLITRVNMLQHNKNDARTEVYKAVEVAKNKMHDEDLEEYLNKCIDVIERVDFDDVRGPKVLEKREKQIIGMMEQSTMKEEAAYLFRQMATMPAARRLSVMPGVRLENSGDADKGFRKKSIMPANKDDDDEKLVPRKKSQRRDSKGVGFMELIQYHVE